MVPEGQTQAPFSQRWPAPHARPQEPQFAVSLAVDTQAFEHDICPAAHVELPPPTGGDPADPAAAPPWAVGAPAAEVPPIVELVPVPAAEKPPPTDDVPPTLGALPA